MHGMWAQDFNGSYPTFCGKWSNDSYKNSKIESSLLTELNANWEGLYSNT